MHQQFHRSIILLILSKLQRLEAQEGCHSGFEQQVQEDLCDLVKDDGHEGEDDEDDRNNGTQSTILWIIRVDVMLGERRDNDL